MEGKQDVDPGKPDLPSAFCPTLVPSVRRRRSFVKRCYDRPSRDWGSVLTRYLSIAGVIQGPCRGPLK